MLHTHTPAKQDEKNDRGCHELLLNEELCFSSSNLKNGKKERKK